MSLEYKLGRTIGGLSDEELEALVSLDLTYSYSRVYLSLLRSGYNLTVGEVADMEKMNRNDVYDILRVLHKRGIVGRRCSWPFFYEAFRPGTPEIEKAVERTKRARKLYGINSKILERPAAADGAAYARHLCEAINGEERMDEVVRSHGILLYMIDGTIGMHESEAARINPNSDLINPINRSGLGIPKSIVFAELRKLRYEGVLDRRKKAGRTTKYYTTKERWNDYLQRNGIEIRDYSHVIG